MAKTEVISPKDAFEPVEPDISRWPIYQISQNKLQFLRRVIDTTVEQIIEEAGKGEEVDDEIAAALYHERIRITENPWKIDPEDEPVFWQSINDRLIKAAVERMESKAVTPAEKEIVQDIVTRYAFEIAGTFNPRTYLIGRKLVPQGFVRLLNASARTNPILALNERRSLEERFHIRGHLEEIREAAKKGTVVMLPTHLSNIDSLVMGWANEALGLPAFMYGAGFNLFNIKLLAFLMNRLGAYKIDRRKKNNIYLKTLKTYSTLALQEEAHMIFFPGGTRSRSGMIENKLKLGLLGTTIEAQRQNFLPGGSQKKLFIVPVALGYHFVLEAPALIRDFLERTGKEKFFIENDELSTSYKLSKVIYKFFKASSDIAISFGKPMDVFGYQIDSEGNSRDTHGNVVDIRKYFMTKGVEKEDPQRDEEYTRRLSEIIVDQYSRINIVFTSHLVAFAAFEILQLRYKKLDLYELLRIPEEEIKIDRNEFVGKVAQLKEALIKLSALGKIELSAQLQLTPEEIVEHGVKHVGEYHVQKPLLMDDTGHLITENLRLLYYYHNRLHGYGLEKVFKG